MKKHTDLGCTDGKMKFKQLLDLIDGNIEVRTFNSAYSFEYDDYYMVIAYADEFKKDELLFDWNVESIEPDGNALNVILSEGVI